MRDLTSFNRLQQLCTQIEKNISAAFAASYKTVLARRNRSIFKLQLCICLLRRKRQKHESRSFTQHTIRSDLRVGHGPHTTRHQGTAIPTRVGKQNAGHQLIRSKESITLFWPVAFSVFWLLFLGLTPQAFGLVRLQTERGL